MSWRVDPADGEVGDVGDVRQPRHAVAISEAREVGARAAMAHWDYTRTLQPGTALTERARRTGWAAFGSITFIAGTLKALAGEVDISRLAPSLVLGLRGLRATYYELRDFRAELLTRTRLMREIARLKHAPGVYTRVCEHCGGSRFDLVRESHNQLRRHYSRRCATCFRGETLLSGGKDPLMLYNGYDLTEHMDFFGVADHRLVLGVRTAPGLGSDDEYEAVRRLVLG